MEEYTKTCSSCGEDRLLSEFGLDKSKADGHRGVCKSCRNSKNKQVAKPKVTSELEIFRSKAYEIIDKIGILNDSERKFLSTMSQKALEFHEEIVNPPTCTMEILDIGFLGCDNFNSTAAVIASKLSLFLVQKKGYVQEFTVIKHEKYNRNKLIIVTILENVKLTHKEIEEFQDILDGSIKKEKLVMSFIINAENMNMGILLPNLPELVSKFLRIWGGFIVKESTIAMSISLNRVKVSWPKRYSVPETEMPNLEKIITDFITDID